MLAGICTAILVALVGEERTAGLMQFLALLLRSAAALTMNAFDVAAQFLRVVGAADAAHYVEKKLQPVLLRWELSTLYPDVKARRGERTRVYSNLMLQVRE